LSEITELNYTSLIKIIIKEENLKWHLEAFASELFNWDLSCLAPLTSIFSFHFWVEYPFNNVFTNFLGRHVSITICLKEWDSTQI